MKPVDPRLLKWATATRRFLVASVFLAVLTSLLIILQAWMLADALSAVFLGGEDLAQIWSDVVVLTGVIVARSVIAYGLESLAFHSSAQAKSQLRMAVLEHSVALGPGFLEDQQAGDLAQLATRGIDALDDYFSRYLPQLVLAVIIPITVGVAILTQDLLATIIIAVTLPLIPIFMILVGLYTQREIDKQWRTLGQLSGHFLDVVAGLPTLKVFNRAKAQAQTLRTVGARYRQDTMRVLRVSFLSSMVLELLATISVAIVAVAIGLRLVNGDLDLRTALIVLILAPEAYLPLRMVGTHYHAAADGIAASGQLLDILDMPLPEQPDPADNTLTVAQTVGADIQVSDVTVQYPGRPVPALDHVSAHFPGGQVTAIAGPSGSGKSTLLQVLLGIQPTDSGAAEFVADGQVQPVAALPRDEFLPTVAWLPQSPLLVEGTVAQNVRLGREAATDADVAAALQQAGLAQNAIEAQQWAQRRLGERGEGLSAGQAQRVALARVAVRNADLVLLDEPSAALDPETEQSVVQLIAGLKAGGATVIVVAHRESLIAAADHVLNLLPTPGSHESKQADQAEVMANLPGLRR
ncbi:MAG: thiol reductant ABC exporter subunit CydD [Actinomycetia bacterium]|nr:thiol reductant ABC exporter subunit CydD [Actinomycetes bacterium]